MGKEEDQPHSDYLGGRDWVENGVAMSVKLGGIGWGRWAAASGAAVACVVALATPASASGSDSGYISCSGGSWVVTRGEGTGTQRHYQYSAYKDFPYASNTVRLWSPAYYHYANWQVNLSYSINMTGTYAYCPS